MLTHLFDSTFPASFISSSTFFSHVPCVTIANIFIWIYIYHRIHMKRDFIRIYRRFFIVVTINNFIITKYITEVIYKNFVNLGKRVIRVVYRFSNDYTLHLKNLRKTCKWWLKVAASLSNVILVRSNKMNSICNKLCQIQQLFTFFTVNILKWANSGKN